MTAPGHPTHGSRLRWRGLVPGIVFLTTIVILAAGVLVFADIGAVRGTTIPVHVAFSEAREIIPNTEVWLNGERIGAVRSVQFQPATSEPDKRLVVTLDLLEVARPYVRRDATVQVRRGESFLGAPVIYVSGGTASTHAV